MLNTRDEQHTLSQPTRRRANTANGKEGLKHASTLRYIQNTGEGQRGEDMLRPRIKAMRAERCNNIQRVLIRHAYLKQPHGRMQKHTLQLRHEDHLGPPNQNGKTLDNQCGKNGPQAHLENPGEHTARIDTNP